ncbi:MAG: nitrogenase iron-molybdenum cofactor biosynthesis protein NifN [Gammaproteobacteria bacterium]|jgi:nitrogenase molybdenum-iron protein NifN
MAELIKRKKALSVSPLKASQPVGAALAFLGIDRAIPMLHGSQGCTAFGKVFFVRHFREPIPLQTTAMDQVSSVMGADDNIVEGLRTVCEKSKPALIGLPTTGLAETQGADVRGAVSTFRKRHPEYDTVKVVPVNTPDFTGCLETGYAAALYALIDCLVAPAAEAGTRPGQRRRQINVLAGSALTPGDGEALKELLETFGLRPVLVPDIAGSLDGHLGEDPFSPVTTGGTPVSELATLGDAVATLVIGASLDKAAELLHERTGVPAYRFEHLMGLDAMDALVAVLADISGRPVPDTVQRHRAQLQDAMLDTHFMLGQARIAVAADPDELHAFGQFLQGMGAELVAAVTPSRTPVLARVCAAQVQIGDLEDLERAARANGAQLLIGNSHAAESARRLGVPLLRAGFPQYDLVGGYQRTWVGYRGSRQALFDLANLLLMQEHHEIKPYHSIYAQKPGQPAGGPRPWQLSGECA